MIPRQRFADQDFRVLGSRLRTQSHPLRRNQELARQWRALGMAASADRPPLLDARYLAQLARSRRPERRTRTGADDLLPGAGRDRTLPAAALDERLRVAALDRTPLSAINGAPVDEHAPLRHRSLPAPHRAGDAAQGNLDADHLRERFCALPGAADDAVRELVLGLIVPE